MRQRATTIGDSQPRPFLSPVTQPLVFRVRLVRKFAERLNGVDLSNIGVGDCLDLSSKEAGLLMAEGWGELVEQIPPRQGSQPTAEQGHRRIQPCSNPVTTR